MRKPAPEHVIRDFIPGEDDPLIFDSWTRQIGKCEPMNRWPSQEKIAHRQVILEQLVKMCPTVVAAHPRQHFVLYGWACGGLTASGVQVLHFAFVRANWRRRGLAERLVRCLFPHLGEHPVYYTHNSRMARSLGKRWQAFWNPYLIDEELV